MAKSAISPRVRLVKLQRAEDDFVTSLAKDMVLDAKPMAQVLRVTWDTLRGWVDEIPALEASGAVERGGQGINWRFKPLETIWTIKAAITAKAELAEAKNRTVQADHGIRLDESEDSASLAEVKDMVNLTITLVSAAEKQARYIEAEKVDHFIEGYNQRVVSAILGVRTQTDPNGNLPPAVRTQMDDYLRSVAMHVNAEAAQFVMECRESFQPAGARAAG